MADPLTLEGDELYERDFYTWTQHQAAALRRAATERLNTSTPIDWDHVAEEIEDMGKARATELRSRLSTLLMHLLKWEFQPKRRSSSWEITIVRERLDIAELLEENPGLRPQLGPTFTRAYRRAIRLAEVETGMGRGAFPADCPYTIEQALDDDFWPGPSGDPGRG